MTKPPIRLGVTGSRHWSDRFLLFNVLDYLRTDYAITLLIHGGAIGADTMADEWAKSRGIEPLPIRPNYEKYGRKVAPAIRNAEIVAASDAVVAFRARGLSDGTDDTTRKAEKAGKLWLVINDWRVTT